MIDSGSHLRKWLFFAGGIACLLAAFALVSTFKGRFPSDPPSVHTSASRPSAQTAADEFDDNEEAGSNAKSDKCVIYITGAVARPGVYEVPAGSRVDDALRAAGGFTSKADPEAVNLAARIEDEEHIKIPSRGEPQQSAAAQQKTATGAADSQAPKSSVSSKSSGAHASGEKIDINRANAAELMTLPGIGPKLSQTIIDYRDANGAFKSTEEIRKVKGIGQKRFESIQDMITTGK